MHLRKIIIIFIIALFGFGVRAQKVPTQAVKPFKTSPPYHILTPRPTATPTPTPTPSLSPSPSPSSEEGGEGANEGGGSEGGNQPTGGGGKATPSPYGGTSTPRSQPPWFGECNGKNERSDKVNVELREGHFVGPPTKQGQKVACRAVAFFCGQRIIKEQVVSKNKPGACDQVKGELDDMLGTGTSICCDEFRKAKGTHKPCDPGIDIDCDGVPNQDDDYPFDPNRSVNSNK